MTELTFQLRPGVSWHDGSHLPPVTSKCTWELILAGCGQAAHQPRKSWYRNLDRGQAPKDDTR